MPPVKRFNLSKALIIGVITLVVVFFLPRILGAMFDDNDWKSLTGTVDGLSYIVIHPSWGKSMGLGAHAGTIIGALVGAAIVGYAIGWGTQDKFLFSIGGSAEAKAKNEAITIVITIAIGLLISFLSWWLSAETAQQNTTYTVPAAQFDQSAAKKGKYDKEFHKYAQADPVKDKAFPPREGLYK